MLVGFDFVALLLALVAATWKFPSFLGCTLVVELTGDDEEDEEKAPLLLK